MKDKIISIDAELVDFLNEKVLEYNNPKFIESDPIQIPHKFTVKEDIEIAGFLTATIAWGNRKMIIKNANRMMELMGHSPYDFIMSFEPQHLNKINAFVHRTFNTEDFIFFLHGLRNIYSKHEGMEAVFSKYVSNTSTQIAIHEFKKTFFSIEHPSRSQKHVSDPLKGSSAKRINMMLRWFCRNDNMGVDFGIWDSISPAILSCPLDVHSGRVARDFGLLKRKQNDAKAVLELDEILRKLDPIDPSKYDFALFGLGVFEKF